MKAQKVALENFEDRALRVANRSSALGIRSSDLQSPLLDAVVLAVVNFEHFCSKRQPRSEVDV